MRRIAFVVMLQAWAACHDEAANFHKLTTALKEVAPGVRMRVDGDLMRPEFSDVVFTVDLRAFDADCRKSKTDCEQFIAKAQADLQRAIAPPKDEGIALDKAILAAANRPVAPAPNGVVGTAAECAGNNLNLDRILDGTFCDGAAPGPGAAVAGDADLAIETLPTALKLNAGKSAKLEVVLRNKTSKVLPLVIPATCGKTRAFDVAIWRGNERVDLDASECPIRGDKCASHDPRIRLSPAGRAAVTLHIEATKKRLDAQCNAVPTGPIPPGKYTATVFTSLLAEDGRRQRSISVPVVID